MKYTTLIINCFFRCRVRLHCVLSYPFIYWLCKAD